MTFGDNLVKSRPICRNFHHWKKEPNFLPRCAVFSTTSYIHISTLYLVKCTTSSFGAV